MAPTYSPPALPLGYIAAPLSEDDRSLGLKFHLVRPGIAVEQARRRRRVPVDEAELDTADVDAAPVRAQIPQPKPKPALDVHRTVMHDEMRQRIIRLFTAAEPVPIRIISKRFGLSYKAVWQVVAHLVKPKRKQRPRVRSPRTKRRLGLSFPGSVALGRK